MRKRSSLMLLAAVGGPFLTDTHPKGREKAGGTVCFQPSFTLLVTSWKGEGLLGGCNHSKFGCWKLLPKKEKEQRQKQLDVSFSDVFSLPVHFEFFAIFSYCLDFAKFICLLKRLQRSKQEWQKSPAGTRQTYGKN
jgi:hypothetical protein